MEQGVYTVVSMFLLKMSIIGYRVIGYTRIVLEGHGKGRLIQYNYSGRKTIQREG